VLFSVSSRSLCPCSGCVCGGAEGRRRGPGSLVFLLRYVRWRQLWHARWFCLGPQKVCRRSTWTTSAVACRTSLSTLCSCCFYSGR